jgi:hypothetical protein
VFGRLFIGGFANRSKTDTKLSRGAGGVGGKIITMYVFHVMASVGGKPFCKRFDNPGFALEEARALLGSGAEKISIHNNHGDHIEGSELVDCCRYAQGIQYNLKPVIL